MRWHQRLTTTQQMGIQASDMAGYLLFTVPACSVTQTGAVVQSGNYGHLITSAVSTYVAESNEMMLLHGILKYKFCCDQECGVSEHIFQNSTRF